MSTLVLEAPAEIQRDPMRRVSGADRYDEVWDGLLREMPVPNDQHQDIVQRLSLAFGTLYGPDNPPWIRPGVEVSDRAAGWRSNSRVPDFVIDLAGTTAINHGAH